MWQKPCGWEEWKEVVSEEGRFWPGSAAQGLCPSPVLFVLVLVSLTCLVFSFHLSGFFCLLMSRLKRSSQIPELPAPLLSLVTFR